MLRYLIERMLACLAAVRDCLLAGSRRRRLELARIAFTVKPYLQLGDKPGQLKVTWCTSDTNSKWRVEIADTVTVFAVWRNCRLLPTQTVTTDGGKQFTCYQAVLPDLTPGQSFRYRVLRNDDELFAAGGAALKLAQQQKWKAVVLGDMGDGHPPSRQVAHRLSLQSFDVAVITGDIVYSLGLTSEYLEKFFPVYNSDTASPDKGAPLIRSRLYVPCVGNHDMGIMSPEYIADPAEIEDMLAYFAFWSQPNNGPGPQWAQVNQKEGDCALVKLAKAGLYRRTNFSFDHGNAHWLILDGNLYMDWSDQSLRDWVDSDLSAAATWKFVVFHQPPFTCNLKYANEQRMRLLCDLFEKHGVDIVFNGHSHLYERTYPLTFKANATNVDERGRVDGEFTFDRQFDGKTQTRKAGVIYITTGAGGKNLGLDHIIDFGKLPPWTSKLETKDRSFTHLDVDGTKLILTQIAADGSQLDRIVIVK